MEFRHSSMPYFIREQLVQDTFDTDISRNENTFV